MGACFRGAARGAVGIGLFVALSGCGAEVVGVDPGTGGSSSTSSSSSSTSSSSSSTSSASSSSGSVPGPWTTLIQGSWSLQPGTEAYWCTVKTLPEDTYIKAFRAKAPTGTHHTLLLRTSGQTDGEGPCGPTLGADMLHASGVGTDDLSFPDGVAVKVPAGTQLLLNLHLFNASSSPISGTSATEVQLVPASAVQQVAEMLLPGSTSINIPPNGSQTVEAKCAFPSQATISTVWPHMHTYGTHMTVTWEGASGVKVLHDAPYSFSDQKNHPIDPVTVAAGEIIQVTCAYQNPTSQPIYFGDSSKSEMCFAGLYVYPMLGELNCQ